MFKIADNFKILVVDDEPSIREVLKIYMEERGFEVHLAENGEEAITLFKAHQPQIVFLDLLIPGKMGREVLREIRSLAPKTLVIIITGFSEDETMSIIGSLDIQGIINKPFRMNEVEKQILSLVKKINLSDDLQTPQFL